MLYLLFSYYNPANVYKSKTRVNGLLQNQKPSKERIQGLL